MEREKRGNLPLVGRIQHGEQDKNKRVKELGYFIPKINNSIMDYLGNRFNEKYPKENKIKVRFFDENPLSIRNVRYNQGGTVCYCMENETQARRKISGKWEKVECSENCEHRLIEEGKNKPACNREGKLFFMLPDISSDRIWYMKITGQKSIDRLETYLKFQKQIGNSLIGDFIIYLTQEPQTTREGKTFNNYILGIYKEDFDSNETIPKKENNKTEDLKLPDKTINKKTESISKKEELEPKEQENIIKVANNNDSKEASKPAKQIEKIKETKKGKTTNKPADKTTEDNTNKYYALIGTTKTKIMNKNELKEYVVGNFFDSEDKPIDVIVPHEYAEELTNCDLGTMVELDIKKAGDKLFTNSIKYIQKYIKNVAA